jgi:hypothetical protein
MSKIIYLSKSHESIVDDDMYEWISSFKWHLNTEGYACRTVDSGIGKGSDKKVWMHRVIIQVPQHLDVDHINQCKLDNRRENLRAATRSQNCANKPANKNNRSGYKGVYWLNQKKRWIAQVGVDLTLITLGSFRDKEEAAYVYDQAVIQIFGEFAYTNILLAD